MQVKKPICECGYTFTEKDIKKGVRPISNLNLSHDFYGGNVKNYCNVTCTCGKKYILFTKPEANTQKVKVISEIEKDIKTETKKGR